jgi:hypothetical protein
MIRQRRRLADQPPPKPSRAGVRRLFVCLAIGAVLAVASLASSLAGAWNAVRTESPWHTQAVAFARASPWRPIHLGVFLAGASGLAPATPSRW